MTHYYVIAGFMKLLPNVAFIFEMLDSFLFHPDHGSHPGNPHMLQRHCQSPFNTGYFAYSSLY